MLLSSTCTGTSSNSDRFILVQCVVHQKKLVNRVTNVLEKGQGNIKAAVFDHIVSFPPVVLPLTELIAACRTVRTWLAEPVLPRSLSICFIVGYCCCLCCVHA